MEYEDKKEEYNRIMSDMGKNLKPIFDRMIEAARDNIESRTSTDYTNYVPPCGITSRNVPLTEEQIQDAEKIVNTAVSSIMDATEDYPEIVNQIPQRVREMADRGEGGNEWQRVRMQELEFPEWLEEIESSVGGYFSSVKGRKGLDWEEMIKGRISKAKDRLIREDNALYVFIDTSGSMSFNTDENGVPLIKLFASYLPTIASKYKGEVWQTTSAPLDDPKPIKKAVPLEDFNVHDLEEGEAKALDVIGGKGTDFAGVFQYFDKLVREKKAKNPNAKVMLIFFSDMDENTSQNPHFIHGKDIIFVTDNIPPPDNDVMQYINGDNIKLIAVNKKPK